VPLPQRVCDNRAGAGRNLTHAPNCGCNDHNCAIHLSPALDYKTLMGALSKTEPVAETIIEATVASGRTAQRK